MTANPASDGIGILLLDEEEHYIIGDPGNPETFDFRALHRKVPGATVARVLNRDPTLVSAFVQTARELQDEGVRGIAGCCGHFIHYQQSVADAVNLPVALSSLLQVQPILSQFSRAKSLGILIGSPDRVKPLRSTLGTFDQSRIHIAGVFERGGAVSAFEADGTINPSVFEAAVLNCASSLLERHADIGALLLETSFFAPYAARVQNSLQCPVFDFVTLIERLYLSTHRERPPAI